MTTTITVDTEVMVCTVPVLEADMALTEAAMGKKRIKSMHLQNN